jgi:hypothetical protein
MARGAAQVRANARTAKQNAKQGILIVASPLASQALMISNSWHKWKAALPPGLQCAQLPRMAHHPPRVRPKEVHLVTALMKADSVISHLSSAPCRLVQTLDRALTAGSSAFSAIPDRWRTSFGVLKARASTLHAGIGPRVSSKRHALTLSRGS